MEPRITDERIARQPPEAQAMIRMLLAKIAKLEAELEELRRQVQGKTPQNSSLPPSTQHPHAKPKPRARKSKRRRGRQPGHAKHERPLIPTEDCDAVESIKPKQCRRCGGKLAGSDPQPLRHQVWELPEIKPVVTEYDLRRATCKLFEHWGNYRDGPITRAALQRRMAPLRREVERLLLRGAQSGNPKIQGMCQELYDHRDWLWTFVRHEGVEPTNNASERSLRHAVIWRKLSFGTQSAAGSRFTETMLTVIETCRQQRRKPFAFITAAAEAHLAGQAAPSLLSRP